MEGIRGPPDRPGVVAFITVAGFVNGPGFSGMRAYLRHTADAVWVIDCSPEGHQPDVPTRIFQGVQQPVCITIAVRDGTTNPDQAAPVRYTSVTGRREDKFAALANLHLDDDRWADCPNGWQAPFLPAGGSDWRAFPAIDELLAWSGSGTMPGRTWVVDPSPDALRVRWERLITADGADKPGLLAEHPTDRRVNTRLGDNLPGYETPALPIGDETGPCPEPERYGYRSFDRTWIIPDKRVINRPNPALWQVRHAPGQTYLTMLSRSSPANGPALTATALVPDLDHYRGSFGGRAWPLWLDSAGTVPNVLPGLLDYLERRYGRAVPGPDVLAYVAALAAHPGYTARFAANLLTRGLRLPLTADADLFAAAVAIGRRVLWLHTFGQCYVDISAGRPVGVPRLAADRRPSVAVAIPDTTNGMPEAITYDPATRVLAVGEGRITPVEPAAWEYEVSGMRVVKRWFDRRKKAPDGRHSSPLDDDTIAMRWPPEWTTQLLQVLNVLTLLVDMEHDQGALLDAVSEGPLVSVADLTDAAVLPATRRPDAEKPPRATTRLF